MIITPTFSSRTFVPALFTATVFLSASLLFFVQPLFARIVLPQIGGAPAVWTTAMLFFQSVLIGGYVYAHLLTRHVPVWAQIAIHLGLWGLALTCLPLAIHAGWRYDADASPALQTLSLFAAGVGLPFFVLSANAPLIQSWYARSDGPSSDDPYFLYGASNVGSLLALLAFPLLAEPLFGAARISLGWSAGFLVLGGALLLSGLAARRSPLGSTAAVSAPVAALPTKRRIGFWLLLAFVPSSLMLAVTSKTATDMGSIPLFWVIPLALYLLTFVLTFTNRPVIGPQMRFAGFILGLMSLAMIFAGLVPLSSFKLPIIGLMTIAFFAVSLFAHGLLYDSRPTGAHLTLFYVIMSVGGALGGLFNSILAPVLFSGPYEGAVTVALAALLLRSVIRSEGSASSRPRVIGTSLVIGFALSTPILTFRSPSGEELFRDRSFFGSHLVRDVAGIRIYQNGTTVHGAQRVDEVGHPRPTPMTYYNQNGPLAQVLTSERGMQAQRVGIVGLGVGSLACYRQPGQDWHFYEIDSMVDAVARDPALFSFMSSCAGDAPTHLGDARLVLAQQQDIRFDILIIDAYSSDAVPVHLTTTEAMQLYLDRLTPEGLLVYHISNRHFEIHRPLARSAASLGLVAQRQVYSGTSVEDLSDIPSEVVLIARNKAALGDLGADTRWSPLPSDGGCPWTDDYANVLSILR